MASTPSLQLTVKLRHGLLTPYVFLPHLRLDLTKLVVEDVDKKPGFQPAMQPNWREDVLYPALLDSFQHFWEYYDLPEDEFELLRASVLAADKSNFVFLSEDDSRNVLYVSDLMTHIYAYLNPGHPFYGDPSECVVQLQFRGPVLRRLTQALQTALPADSPIADKTSEPPPAPAPAPDTPAFSTPPPMQYHPYSGFITPSPFDPAYGFTPGLMPMQSAMSPRFRHRMNLSAPSAGEGVLHSNPIDEADWQFQHRGADGRVRFKTAKTTTHRSSSSRRASSKSGSKSTPKKVLKSTAATSGTKKSVNPESENDAEEDDKETEKDTEVKPEAKGKKTKGNKKKVAQGSGGDGGGGSDSDPSDSGDDPDDGWKDPLPDPGRGPLRLPWGSFRRHPRPLRTRPALERSRRGQEITFIKGNSWTELRIDPYESEAMIDPDTGLYLPWIARRPDYGEVLCHPLPTNMSGMDRELFMSNFVRTTQFNVSYHGKYFQQNFPVFNTESSDGRYEIFPFFNRVVSYCANAGVFVPPPHTYEDGCPLGRWFEDLNPFVQSAVATTFGTFLAGVLKSKYTGLAFSKDSQIKAIAYANQDGYDILYNLVVYAGHPQLQAHPSASIEPKQGADTSLYMHVQAWIHFCYIQQLGGTIISDRYFYQRFIHSMHPLVRAAIGDRLEADIALVPIDSSLPQSYHPDRLVPKLLDTARYNKRATYVTKTPRELRSSERAIQQLDSPDFVLSDNQFDGLIQALSGSRDASRSTGARCWLCGAADCRLDKCKIGQAIKTDPRRKKAVTDFLIRALDGPSDDDDSPDAAESPSDGLDDPDPGPADPDDGPDADPDFR